MNISIATAKINTLFLSAILVAGIVALLNSSFMTASAQAEPYYGMDKDRKSYGKDASVKSIKCNNINVNVNGLELNVLPQFLTGLVSDGKADEGAYSYGGGNGNYGSESLGSDKDFKFVCINNNNNTVIGEGEEPIPPETSACIDCFSVLNQTQIGRLLAIVGATSVEVYCELLLATPNSPAESLAVRDVLNNIPGIFQSQFIEILQCLIDEGVIGPIPPPPP